MRLVSFNYNQFKGMPREWEFTGLVLGPVNLIVGKNATGKTRMLNVIQGLARLLSGKQKLEFVSGTYDATFEHDGKTTHYYLEIQDRKVAREEYKEGNRTVLQRGLGGSGVLYHEKEGKNLEFQSPETDLAAVARVDHVQHTFLEPLRQWGNGVRHYLFGEAMGRTVFAVVVKDMPPPDPADVNAVIALFRKASKEYPNRFQEAVKQDMNAVGYEIEEVGVMEPTDVTIQSPVPMNPVILFVKERDLSCVTQQTEISQGMFRVLSTLIHLNYAAFTSEPSCIVIDDIGEGLDFERSCRLIELIKSKALRSSVQLIMSTNDRFVMNNVPLEEWTVLQREGGRVRVRNYQNSRPVFEEFKFTGLSNFSFLEMDFANELPTEEAAAHE